MPMHGLLSLRMEGISYIQDPQFGLVTQTIAPTQSNLWNAF